MATARNAYTSEYQYGFQPEVRPERVRRTRQRPEINKEPQKQQEVFLTPANLRILIVAVLLVGALLIGMVVVNAQAAKLQYSINQLRNQNNLIQNEINMLDVKIERETGIENLEAYATGTLGMFYPQGSQCIHIAAMGEAEGSLAELIKQKAYE